MIKKILSVFLAVILQSFFLLADAKTVKVIALDDFYSVKPPYNFNVKLVEPLQISDTRVLYPSIILSGYIYKTIPPKRLKQDANFVFIPTSYIDSQNKSNSINNIVATYSNKVNKTELVVSSALVFTFGLIPALLATTGFFAAEGAINDKTGDKLSSSVNNAYDKSFLSLGEKGKELYIRKNQEFLLNIAIIREQAPNYSYTQGR